jgi:hypothetical protein
LSGNARPAEKWRKQGNGSTWQQLCQGFYRLGFLTILRNRPPLGLETNTPLLLKAGKIRNVPAGGDRIFPVIPDWSEVGFPISPGRRDRKLLPKLAGGLTNPGASR